MQDEVRVPLTEIAEQGAAMRQAVAAADELGVPVAPDWAERPSVPLAVAGKVLARAVELRDVEARWRLAAAGEQIAALERVRPVLRGIPAPPGVNVPAVDVMRASDADREDGQW